MTGFSHDRGRRGVTGDATKAKGDAQCAASDTTCGHDSLMAVTGALIPLRDFRRLLILIACQAWKNERDRPFRALGDFSTLANFV